jgi:hypothetical protein
VSESIERIAMGKSGRELFDDYIKHDWPREVKEAGVKKRNNTAYVPVLRNVSLLRDDVNAFDEAVRIWSEDEAGRMAPGYAAIVEQAGVEFTWEYALIDPDRPWADDVPSVVRARIEAFFPAELDDLRRRAREGRERVTAVQAEMRSGQRRRIKLPGE